MSIACVRSHALVTTMSRRQQMTRLRKLVRHDQGQDLIEYALLVGFLAWVSVEWVLLKLS